MVEAAAKEGRTLAVAAALVLLPILIRSRIILTIVSTGREFPESGREKALSRPDGKFKSGISGQNQSSNYGLSRIP